MAMGVAGRTGSRSGNGRLPFFPLLAFSMLAVPVSAAQMPIGVYLPAIYGSAAFKIPLGLLGIIFLAERIWGTLTDPLIGAFSDHTRSRFGRRRSWIAAGGVVFGVSGIALFFPPAEVSGLYLGLSLFAFYLGWSMLQIPYWAWSGEISDDYQERTRVATYQQVTGAVALLLVLILPTIVDQFRPNDGRLKLAAMGGTILITLLPGLILTLRAFPERAPAQMAEVRRPSFLAAMRIIVGDRLLLRVLASDFCVTLGQGIRGTLFLFFVSIYMGLPRWASGMFLVQFAFGILAGPIWLAIGRRFGKHRTAIIAELVQVAINLGLLLVMPGRLPLLLGLTIAQGLTQGSGNLMLRAMIADVADNHQLKTGDDRSALFFSVFSLSFKGGTAAAVGIALPLVSALGFDPRVAHNGADALHGLLLVFALGPALCHLVAAGLLRGFPLDEKAYQAVRSALDARALEELTQVPAAQPGGEVASGPAQPPAVAT